MNALVIKFVFFLIGLFGFSLIGSAIFTVQLLGIGLVFLAVVVILLPNHIF